MAGTFEITVVVKLAGNVKMLQRTMESLESQTVDFGKNIQVILVKGSEPEDVNIGQKYIEKYPHNVSLQRTFDIEKIAGSYINYVQEGQYWDKDAYSRVIGLYKHAPNQLPLLREQFVDGQKGRKPQEYCEFVVNTMEKFQDEAGKYFFSARFSDKLQALVMSENRLEKAVILAEILMESQEIGILETIKLYGKKTIYPKKTNSWYVEEMPQFQQKIKALKAIKDKSSKGILDAVFLYQVLESLKEKTDDGLSVGELQQYEKWIGQILQKIDDLTISKAPGMNSPLRVYAFSLKAGKDIREELEYQGGRFLYHNLLIYDMNSKNAYDIVRKTIINDEIQMNIRFYYPLQEEMVPFYLSNGREIRRFSYVENGEKEYICLKHILMQEQEYSCKIPLVHSRNGKKHRVVPDEKGVYRLIYRYKEIYENCTERFDIVEI